jgi:hypothetical protein
LLPSRTSAGQAVFDYQAIRTPATTGLPNGGAVRQALLMVGDARGRLDVQRGEAEAERGADEQQRGQDHGQVVRCRPDPQEPRVTGGQAREPDGDDPGRAEPVEHQAHPRRGGRDEHPGRQERQRGAQRRPAGHDLQVLGDQELERDVRAEQHHDGEVRAGQFAGAEDAQPDQGVAAAALDPEEGTEQGDGGREGNQRPG